MAPRWTKKRCGLRVRALNGPVRGGNEARQTCWKQWLSGCSVRKDLNFSLKLDESSSTTEQFFLKMDFDGSSNGVSPSKMGSFTKKLEDLPFGNITPLIYFLYLYPGFVFRWFFILLENPPWLGNRWSEYLRKKIGDPWGANPSYSYVHFSMIFLRIFFYCHHVW